MATATLRILSSETKSQSLGDAFGANPAKVALEFAEDVSIQGPAALTGTVTVQVAHTSPAADGDFTAHQYLGTDVTVAAAKSNTFPVPSCLDLRLISGSAEGADRDFKVTLRERM